MFCHNCGAEIIAGAKFCARCGVAVVSDFAEENVATETETQVAQTDNKIDEEKPGIGAGFSKFASGLGKFAGAFGQTVASAAKNAANSVSEANARKKEALKSSENIGAGNASENNRDQGYIGYIQKCPNCGQVVSPTDMLCPACGFQFTGRKASYASQQLKAEIMAIENEKGKLFASPSKILDKKVALITNFPIPNTIEEIMDIFILAVSNIKVGLSKKTFLIKNYYDEFFKQDEIKVSNAWVSKMQQAYDKAKLMFPDDPSYLRIQQIYNDKMRELKMMK